MSGSPGTGGSSRESTPPRWWTTWTATPRGTMIVMLPHPRVDVQIDDTVVELGLGEVDPHTAQVRAEVRFPGHLPPSGEAQPPHAGVDLQRLVEPPVRAGEGDRRRQRPDHLGDLGVAGGGEQF